jgi:hypothetical protein
MRIHYCNKCPEVMEAERGHFALKCSCGGSLAHFVEFDSEEEYQQYKPTIDKVGIRTFAAGVREGYVGVPTHYDPCLCRFSEDYKAKNNLMHVNCPVHPPDLEVTLRLCDQVKHRIEERQRAMAVTFCAAYHAEGCQCCEGLKE